MWLTNLGAPSELALKDARAITQCHDVVLYNKKGASSQ